LNAGFIAMMPRLFALAALSVLAACGTSQRGGRSCGSGSLQVTNASAQAVEQFYLGQPGAWGADQLAGGLLLPGATVSVPRPGITPLSLRAVWADGRAAEFLNLDGCAITQVSVADTGMRAQ
jgi:hypothetical protein